MDPKRARASSRSARDVGCRRTGGHLRCSGPQGCRIKGLRQPRLRLPYVDGRAGVPAQPIKASVPPESSPEYGLRSGRPRCSDGGPLSLWGGGRRPRPDPQTRVGDQLLVIRLPPEGKRRFAGCDALLRTRSAAVLGEDRVRGWALHSTVPGVLTRHCRDRTPSALELTDERLQPSLNCKCPRSAITPWPPADSVTAGARQVSLTRTGNLEPSPVGGPTYTPMGTNVGEPGDLVSGAAVVDVELVEPGTRGDELSDAVRVDLSVSGRRGVDAPRRGRFYRTVVEAGVPTVSTARPLPLAGLVRGGVTRVVRRTRSPRRGGMVVVRGRTLASR